MSGYGAGGTAGYTGIGVTGQDVLIYGNLLVTGGIDPTYLALTPQTVGPQGFFNPLWVDSVNSNALRSENILINNPTLNAIPLSVNNSVNTGLLFTKFYNQRTAVVGESIRLDFNAKNNAGSEFNYAKIHMGTGAIGAGSERGSLDFNVRDSAGLTEYLGLNKNASGAIDCFKPISMNSQNIAGVNQLTDVNGINYLPQGGITANSNVPTTIPAYNNNHQLLLRASPVPLIDTFVQQPETIGTCSILCSHTGGGQQWVGTNCGEVYVYDAGSANWKLIFQLYGNSNEIRALYYKGNEDRLYIGGSFQNCSIPGPSATPYNNICFLPSASTTFSQTTPVFIIWSGASQSGFNGAVNAITSDNNTLWFGGDFTADADNLIGCNRIAVYESSPNTLTPLNLTNGDGFDGAVNNLDYFGGHICATGNFVNMISFGVYYYSQYIITFLITSGYNVASVFVFDGGLGNLPYQIPGYDLIKNNGSAFLVGVGQNSYAGADFFFQLSLSAIPSAFLATNLTSQIYSFIYTSGTVYAVSSGGYYSDGALTATIPFSSYLFLANWNGTLYFNNQGVGTQWAFNGSVANVFALYTSGRFLYYQGTTYATSINCPTALTGQNLLLNWNGSYYIVVSQQGTWTFF
jgi:hypothetical protein